jgi:hypothetical protein
VRLSERERTRANAEPCHSCHASVGDETPLSHPRAAHFARFAPGREHGRAGGAHVPGAALLRWALKPLKRGIDER